MLRVLLLVGVGLAVAAAALFAVGAREPVWQLARGNGPVWFVALRFSTPAATSGATSTEATTPDWSNLLRPGVAVHWSSRAVLPVIGGPTPYWHHFALLQGSAADAGPLPEPNPLIEDAEVRALKLERPPRWVLGLLRTMTWLGLWSLPDTPVDVAAFEARSNGDPILPDPGALGALLQLPETLSPAMVNWLAYRDAAAYRDYGLVALQTVYRGGGALILLGAVTDVVRAPTAGPTAGPWDTIAVMRYPTPGALPRMDHVPAYRAALADRDRGLARTVLIASDPDAPEALLR
jgi:hypothetical protein